MSTDTPVVSPSASDAVMAEGIAHEICSRLASVKSDIIRANALPDIQNRASNYKFRVNQLRPVDVEMDGKSRGDMFAELVARFLFYVIRFQDFAVCTEMTQEFMDSTVDRSTVKDVPLENSVAEYLLRRVDHPMLYEVVNGIYAYPSMKNLALFQLNERQQIIEMVRLAREGQFRILKHLFTQRAGSKGFDRAKEEFQWKVRLTPENLELLARRVPRHILGEILEVWMEDPLNRRIEKAEEDRMDRAHKEAKKLKGKVAGANLEKQAYESSMKLRKEFITAWHNHKDVQEELTKAKAAAEAAEKPKSDLQKQVEAELPGQLVKEELAPGETAADRLAVLINKRNEDANKAPAVDLRTTCTSDADFESWTLFAQVLKDATTQIGTLSTQYLPNPLNNQKDTQFLSIFWVLVEALDIKKVLKPLDPSIAMKAYEQVKAKRETLAADEETKRKAEEEEEEIKRKAEEEATKQQAPSRAQKKRNKKKNKNNRKGEVEDSTTDDVLHALDAADAEEDATDAAVAAASVNQDAIMTDSGDKPIDQPKAEEAKPFDPESLWWRKQQRPTSSVLRTFLATHFSNHPLIQMDKLSEEALAAIHHVSASEDASAVPVVDSNESKATLDAYFFNDSSP